MKRLGGKALGRTLAIANKKGGVGKTTTAVNLSALWAVKVKVLLIDIDPQGNSTTALGVDKDKLRFSISNVLKGECKIQEAVIPTGFDNLLLLPAEESLEDLETSDLDVFLLSRKIRPLKDIIDFIVIDCPPSLGRLTLNALAAADRILVPLNAAQFSLEGVQQLLATVKFLKDRGVNKNLEILGFFLNGVQTRTILFQQISKALKRSYGDMVLDTYVPLNVRISEAQCAGEPISYYDKNSIGCEAYLSLAEEVLERWAASEAGNSKKG